MINDEFSGQGGTYLLDPVTGKRTLLKRTAPARAAAESEPSVEPVAEPSAPAPAPADEPAT